MEGTNGLEIAAQLPEKTCFIFTTAYLHYALDGFDPDAVDYLHKPLAFSRFQTAFDKAPEGYSEILAATGAPVTTRIILKNLASMLPEGG